MRVQLWLVGVLMTGLGAEEGWRFEEDFLRWAPGGIPTPRWQAALGEWQVTPQGLVAEGRSEWATLVARGWPPAQAGGMEVWFVVEARTLPQGWAHAGLALYQGPSHFWRLGLVEDPDRKTRRAELVERYDDLWQAQSVGDTRLEGRSGGEGRWEYGRPYRLRLLWDEQRLRGEVATEAGKPRWWMEYPYAGRPAVKRGRLAFITNGLRVRLLRAAMTVPPEGSKVRRMAQRRVAVLKAPEVARWLQEVGWEVQEISLADLIRPETWRADRYGLMVLSESDRFPGPALPHLLSYLQDGGRLLVMGPPPFQAFVWPKDGQWLTPEEILAQVPTRLILRFQPGSMPRGERAASHPQIPFRVSSDPETPEGIGAALKVELADFKGWDTLAFPPFETSPFGPGESLTCFWAKGTKPNQVLAIEWREQDGSRWIASVRLTPQWKRYVLRPQDFAYWPDNPSQGRGGPGDRFHPRNAFRLIVGPAKSHGQGEEGPFTYWLADVGVAPSPLPEVEWKPPTLEGLSPWYKWHEVPSPWVGSGAEAQAPMRALPRPEWTEAPQGWRWEGLNRLDSPIWRPRGLGWVHEQEGRWVPLAEAYDGQGRPRGVVASYYLALGGPLAGAAWGWIGLPKAERERNASALAPLVRSLAHRLAQDIHLVCAGAERWAYFSDQKPRYGAEWVNFGSEPARALLHWELRSATASPLRQGRIPVGPLAPGGMDGVQWEGEPLPAGEYEIVVRLEVGGQEMDRLVQPFRVVEEPKPDPQALVRVEGGDFVQGGQKWYAHGVNYWPLAVSGLEPGRYGAGWLRPENYDPEVIERDLRLLRELGMNLVSIQYIQPVMASALVDFLNRCRRHGIYANVFLAGAHPMAFDPNLVRTLIEGARLWAWENVFAYDIAWEPRWGTYEQRQGHSAQWTRWVEMQYGSLEKAAMDWEFQPRRLPDGRLDVPKEEEILNDGPHRRFVAAYRRFLDDWLSWRTGEVRRFIRSLDPHHLISFRVGYGGTGQPWPDRVMAYDPVAGAKHLDFISPEGYGLPPDRQQARATGFITAYCRWAGNGRPVYWAEYGASIYPGTGSEKVEHQRRIWDAMFYVIADSDANGDAGWWWPGGYRVNENSDFGIINPDGTPRPSALAAKEWAPLLEADLETRTPPQAWLEVDRDLHPRGLSEMWRRHRDEYLRLREQGKAVGLRTAGTGTTSADVPLIAVGNVPCNGHNPPKYLNGEFNYLRIRNAQGQWQEVRDGDQVEVPAGRPLEVQVSLGNTGEATWLPPHEAKVGGVYLTVTLDAETLHRWPIPTAVPRYGDVDGGTLQLEGEWRKPSFLRFRLWAAGRVEFGEERRVRVIPKP